MTDKELILLNEMGFIPGPEESEPEFLIRVEKAKKFFDEGHWIPEGHWHWPRAHLKEVFDFQPNWLPAFYSNEKLTPWQGAASWIEGRELKMIQLRESFRNGGYWGNRREEILAHEAVHAARSAFEESQNEEFFAYMTSEKKWKRVLGPIVQRPWEVWPFLGSLTLGWFIDLGFWMATVWMGLGFWRLLKQHRKLGRAGAALLQVVGSAAKARAVLFRLTDEEIDRFSRGEKIEEYAQMQTDLRWKLIRIAYLKM